MAALSSWVDGNWFSLIQTVGIVGSLLLATAAARREAKSREIENLLTISEHHRSLWNEAHQRKDLERIFEADLDVLKNPATVAENEFLNLIFAHYQTGWNLSKTGAFVSLDEMKSDVRGFFTLPLPHAVWEKTKKYRNRKFVRFVTRALANS
jgi:hypothetical protein